MQFTYELTQKDFYDSFIAHRRRNKFTKWLGRIAVLAVLMLVAAGLVVLIFRPDRETFTELRPLLVVAVIWTTIYWGLPWWAARSQFQNQPSARGQRVMSLDTVGVHCRQSGGSYETEWCNFIRWRET